MARLPDSIEQRQHVARINGARLMVVAVIMFLVFVGYAIFLDHPRKMEDLKVLILPLILFGFGFKIRTWGKHGLPAQELPPPECPMPPPPADPS